MEARAAFPAELRSAVDARRFAERTLVEWGCEALLESARLLVSELVVNAILHAHSPADLCLRFDDGVLRVDVADTSTSPLHRRPYSPTATTGRGLMILDALADEWGVIANEQGKTVWFRMAVDPLTQPDIDAGPGADPTRQP